MKLRKITLLCGGTLHGNPEYEIKSIARIEKAEKDSITFYSGDDENLAKRSKAGCIIAKFKITNKNTIEVDNPEEYWNCFIKNFFKNLLVDFEEQTYTKGENSKIGKNTKIGYGTYIGKEVTIGNNTKIFPGVKIMDRVKIGNNVVIHPGVVIGSPGFGFFKKGNSFVRREQIGNVIIEDNVEIGANTVIDRGSIENTIIGKGTKIDALCMIGHGVKIGKNCIIIGGTAIGGSSTIGNNVLISGKVSIIDHINICDDVIILADAGVYKDITERGTYAGKPARKKELYWKAIAKLYRET